MMVRAYNVHAGDELSFYNTKTHRENRLVVHAVEHRRPLVLLTLKGKSGATRQKRYLQQLSWHGLVRVRRLEPAT